jgi:hypothetical protein
MELTVFVGPLESRAGLHTELPQGLGRTDVPLRQMLGYLAKGFTGRRQQRTQFELTVAQSV